MFASKILSLDDLDALLKNGDMSGVYGVQVDYHGETLTFTEHGLEKTFTCAQCGQDPYVAYITRGAPGWCYVHDKNDHYLADLRNQDWYCDVCMEIIRRQRNG